MTGETVISGGCLCGAVRFSAQVQARESSACHCGTCRRWASGPFFAVDCGDSVSFEKTDGLSVFVSSDWAERGFCSACGSSLFWKPRGAPHYMMSTGALDDSDGFALAREVFIDEKPPYYALAGERPRLTGAEAAAAYAGTAEQG